MSSYSKLPARRWSSAGLWDRRQFVRAASVGLSAACVGKWLPASEGERGESLVAYIERERGGFDLTLYRKMLGAANEFKEGDVAVGVAAEDAALRLYARQLLAHTSLGELDRYSIFDDQQTRWIDQFVDRQQHLQTSSLTVGQLRSLLLEADEEAIKLVATGLSSFAIGCVVKIMSNDDLIAVASKVFHPLPGTKLGAKGYLGARVQPNSPTDHLDDIRWQVFNAWSYGVGDFLLGSNPVSGDLHSVVAVERALQEIVRTFGLEQTLPHCVLAHIDVQAEAERLSPGCTSLWFQSIAGCDTANRTFDISIEKMVAHAQSRTGKFDLYFETGQGADFTNGHGHGFDMVLHESRKYGLARGLTACVAANKGKLGIDSPAWVHLNDVAGFIGPEVFRTKEQLVRCCLEDIVMGKLHGLTIGLDVCSTLHMDISLDDLDWCLNEIMPANPAYLMALPTKIDPMLGYLTTGFQDHVRLRERFGYRVDDAMARFFTSLGVLTSTGEPGPRFGDPSSVYVQFCQRRGDTRSEEELAAEATQQMAQVQSRGVFLSRGHGDRPADLAPEIEQKIRDIYRDAKESIWAEFPANFAETVPSAIALRSQSKNREDYILHPTTGEQLDTASYTQLDALRRRQGGQVDVQIVISDGLNALSLLDRNQLTPFLESLRSRLEIVGLRCSSETIVMHSGRVRSGYRIGERLFAGLNGSRAVVHIIGERPGTGHRTFSVYLTTANGDLWGEVNGVDHNITKVVSGIASTALAPELGAEESARLLQLQMQG